MPIFFYILSEIQLKIGHEVIGTLTFAANYAYNRQNWAYNWLKSS